MENQDQLAAARVAVKINPRVSVLSWDETDQSDGTVRVECAIEWPGRDSPNTIMLTSRYAISGGKLDQARGAVLSGVAGICERLLRDPFGGVEVDEVLVR